MCRAICVIVHDKLTKKGSPALGQTLTPHLQFTKLCLPVRYAVRAYMYGALCYLSATVGGELCSHPHI